MSVCFGRQPQQPSQWAGYQPQPEPEPEPDQGGYVDFTAHAAYEPLVTPQPAAALQLGAPGGGGVYLGARRDVALWKMTAPICRRGGLPAAARCPTACPTLCPSS